MDEFIINGYVVINKYCSSRTMYAKCKILFTEERRMTSRCSIVGNNEKIMSAKIKIGEEEHGLI